MKGKYNELTHWPLVWCIMCIVVGTFSFLGADHCKPEQSFLIWQRTDVFAVIAYVSCLKPRVQTRNEITSGYFWCDMDTWIRGLESEATRKKYSCGLGCLDSFQPRNTLVSCSYILVIAVAQVNKLGLHWFYEDMYQMTNSDVTCRPNNRSASKTFFSALGNSAQTPNGFIPNDRNGPNYPFIEKGRQMGNSEKNLFLVSKCRFWFLKQSFSTSRKKVWQNQCFCF